MSLKPLDGGTIVGGMGGAAGGGGVGVEVIAARPTGAAGALKGTGFVRG